MENKFNQLCVWMGTVLGDSPVEELVNFFQSELNTRIQFAEEVITNPSIDENNNLIPDTGGRHDLLFYVHDDDISSFAIKRLGMGIRWWEDVVKYNDNSHLYTSEVLSKYPPKW